MLQGRATTRDDYSRPVIAKSEPPAPDAGPAPTPPAGMQGQLGPLFRIIKDQRVAFLIVGGFNTLIGTAWFIVFQLLLGDHIGRFGYMLSLLCAHVASVLTAFFLNRYLVFRVRGHLWLDLFRFWLVNLTTLGINAVLLPVVVEAFGLRPIVAQLTITAFTALLSYFGHKYFSFRRAPVTVTEVALGDTGPDAPRAPAPTSKD